MAATPINPQKAKQQEQREAEQQLAKTSIPQSGQYSKYCSLTQKLNHDKNSKWSDLPQGLLTEEARLDLKVIQMRGVMDPKRHYKKSKLQRTPKFFQV